MTNELETIEQTENLTGNKPAVLLYFYNDSCAPCISLRPKVIELLENEFPKVQLAFVNSVLHPEVAARYNSFSNPTLILFFDGREYRRESKYISIPQLAESIRRPYEMIF